MISSESPHPLPGPFSEIQYDKFRSQNTPHSWITVRDRDLPRDCVAEWWLRVEFLLKTDSGYPSWCQQNQTKEVESRSTSSERTDQHLVKEINQTQEQSIRLKNKVSWQTSEEIKRDRDMWQKWCVLKKMCRMETSFWISLTLVSNNNYWNPRKLPDQLRVTLKHTPALPIHNGQNYQELKREREKETHTKTTANLTLVSNNNEWTPQILRNQIWVTLTHTPTLPIHNRRNYQELKRERDTRTQPTGRLRLKESERERGRTLKKAHVIPECRNKL